MKHGFVNNINENALILYSVSNNVLDEFNKKLTLYWDFILAYYIPYNTNQDIKVNH